ncbi:MAG: hypothetical protein ACRCUP_05060 [Mycoplasmatales bacterium]
MDENKRVELIKEGLKKDIYEKVKTLKLNDTSDESTAKLANILDGYIGKIDAIDAQSVDAFEDELRLIITEDVEVEIVDNEDQLLKKYNDHIHSSDENIVTSSLNIDNFEFNEEEFAEEIIEEISEDNSNEMETEEFDDVDFNTNDTHYESSSSFTEKLKYEDDETFYDEDEFFTDEYTDDYTDSELDSIISSAEVQESTVDEKKTKKSAKKKMHFIDYVIIVVLILAIILFLYLAYPLLFPPK